MIDSYTRFTCKYRLTEFNGDTDFFKMLGRFVGSRLGYFSADIRESTPLILVCIVVVTALWYD
jgi:hypothetical protein